MKKRHSFIVSLLKTKSGSYFSVGAKNAARDARLALNTASKAGVASLTSTHTIDLRKVEEDYSSFSYLSRRTLIDQAKNWHEDIFRCIEIDLGTRIAKKEEILREQRTSSAALIEGQRSIIDSGVPKPGLVKGFALGCLAVVWIDSARYKHC